MKFDVEIDFHYPGIENDTPEEIQYNLQLLLDRGSQTFNDERCDDWEEDEECTCTGNIIRRKPEFGMLLYYKTSPVPETFEMPSRAQFDDFLSIPGANVEGITYDQFCEASEKGYTKAKREGYVLAVHSKACEYKDAEHLEKIKAELRNEEGFIGFPGDQVIEDLQTDIRKMFKDESD